MYSDKGVNDIKIVAGLGCADDFDNYVKAGADEVFIGYSPYEWQKTHGFYSPINRRESIHVNVNIGSQTELESLAKKAKEKSIPVTVAFNSLSYRPNEYMDVLAAISNCLEVGINNVIVADMGLLYHLSSKHFFDKLRIHVSGEFGEMNTPLIEFLTEFCIKRIIYHRGIGIENMRRMIADFPELEHEAFLMNEKCHFTGAYCNSLHCDELVPMCRMPYMFGDYYGVENEKYAEDCGLCSLKKLESAGVTHVKIVGRGASADTMIKSISLTKEAIRTEHNITNEDEYTFYVKNVLMKERCNHQCYYNY